MIKLLTLLFLLLLSALLKAQSFAVGFWIRPSYISAGEYFPIGYDSLNHQAYHSLNITPQLFTGQPAYVGGVWGGPHSCALIDTLGNLYYSGSNTAGDGGIGSTTGTCSGCMVAITTDSAGNAIPPVKQVLLSGTNSSPYWYTAIVTTTDSVGLAGNLQGGLRGNGTSGANTQTTFVWVHFPAGVAITKIQGLYSIIALDTAGEVYSWGSSNGSYGLGRTGSTSSPGKITLPVGRRAVDIGSTSIFSWILLDNGHILSFGWQADPAYQGLGSSGTVATTPTDVTSNAFMSPMTAAHTPASVYTNNESTYFICTDGTLWAVGGNACGTIGNGKSINFATYSPLYEWNQSQNSNNQDTVYNIAPGTSDWVNVYPGYSNSWYVYAQRSAGQLYAWGRNKSTAIWAVNNGSSSGAMIIDANYTNGNIASTYPDSWTQVWPALIKWPGSTVISQTSCPYCVANPSGSPCNIYTIPTTAAPNANAGSTQNVTGTSTVMSGTASGNGGSIVNYTTYSQVSGPNQAIITFPAVLNTPISGLVTGTYVFQLNVTDQNWRSTTSNVTINVNQPCGCITIPVGVQIKVQ